MKHLLCTHLVAIWLLVWVSKALYIFCAVLEILVAIFASVSALSVSLFAIICLVIIMSILIIRQHFREVNKFQKSQQK